MRQYIISLLKSLFSWGKPEQNKSEQPYNNESDNSIFNEDDDSIFEEEDDDDIN